MNLNSILMAATLGLVMGLSNVAHAKPDHGHTLPPGLQKKAERGQPLPPGWQKKLAVGDTLDHQVYDQGKVVLQDKKDGLLTIKVEGKLIRIIENTHEIVDILDSI